MQLYMQAVSSIHLVELSSVAWAVVQLRSLSELSKVSSHAVSDHAPVNCSKHGQSQRQYMQNRSQGPVHTSHTGASTRFQGNKAFPIGFLPRLLGLVLTNPILRERVGLSLDITSLGLRKEIGMG